MKELLSDRTCVRVISDKEKTLKENDTFVKLKNKAGVSYKIICIDAHNECDGNYLIKDDQRKCDFAILHSGVIFLELKGSDVNHGISQLNETLNWIYKSEKTTKISTQAILVLKRKLSVPGFQNDRKRFSDKWLCLLEIQGSGHTIKIY